MRTLLLPLIVALGGVPAGADGQGRWRPEDRVLMTSFDVIVDLAAADGELYALSERGLLIMDVFARRWSRLSTLEDGFPAIEGPSAAAFDPVDREVWVGTRAGSLYTYHVDFDRWTRETSVDAGPILRLAPYRERAEEGVDVRTPAGWFRVSRFSGFARRLAPSAVGARLRQLELDPEERLARTDAGFAAERGTLLTDARGRRWPLTGFVRDEGEGRYWLGTAGGGVLRYDSRFLRAESYPVGLLTEGVSALGGDEGAIWLAGDGAGSRRGVTRVDPDLRRWAYQESGDGGSPGGPFTDVLPTEGGTWFATDAGAFRLDTSGRWSRAVGAAGSSAIRRLEQGPDGAVWAASEAGALSLHVVGDEVTSRPALFRGERIWTLLTVGDALWVAGDAGVRILVRDASPDTPGGAAVRPPIGPIIELAATREGVWGATSDALWRFDGPAWEGPLREPLLTIGPVRRLRSGGGDLWVAGDAGVARLSTESGDWTYLTVGEDVPAGPVRDVLVHGEQVYVATPRGVLRIVWRRAF